MSSQESTEPTPAEAPAVEEAAVVEATPEPAPEPVTEPVTEPAAPAAAAPKPRPVPKPGGFRAPSPAVVAAHATHPVKVPVAADVSEAELEAAAAFGTVADDVVSVTDGAESHEVGPAQGDEPVAPYVRAYFDLKSNIERFHGRLESAEPTLKDIDDSLESIRGALTEPKVVGDLAALRAAFAPVEAQAVAAREAIAAERRKARKESQEKREEIVARAEAIAAAPVETVHWKNDTATLRALLDEWKEAQRSGARLPKDAERALWKRFTVARTSFEKARKHHFSEIDGANAAVASSKEALVARAEALVETTDFERGAREFRDLMNAWRTAGRGRRSVDDALWKRFQTAQDTFFGARRAQADADEAALAPNIDAAKAAVLAAEALLPIRDLPAAKAALRAAQDAFEAAGRLPRTESLSLSKRLGAVERAVRDSESNAWNARNPELEARVSGASTQLQAAIAELEAKLAAAKTPAEKKSLKEALDARKSWLKQIAG